jgi:peptidoglycan hydrolase CwlO-like protein
MAEIDVATDLGQINTQLEELVAKANELNTQRENLMQQIHNLNGIAMYLRGKEQENGEGVTEDLPQEEFPPPDGE